MSSVPVRPTESTLSEGFKVKSIFKRHRHVLVQLSRCIYFHGDWQCVEFRANTPSYLQTDQPQHWNHWELTWITLTIWLRSLPFRWGYLTDKTHPNTTVVSQKGQWAPPRHKNLLRNDLSSDTELKWSARLRTQWHAGATPICESQEPVLLNYTQSYGPKCNI